MARWRHSRGKTTPHAKASRVKLGLVIAAFGSAALDAVVLGLMAYEHYTVPLYIWATALAFTAVEFSYVVFATLLVEHWIARRQFRRSHADLAIGVLPCWGASAASQFLFWLAYQADGPAPTLFTWIQLGVSVGSIVFGLAFGVCAAMKHLLVLNNDSPDQGGAGGQGEQSASATESAGSEMSGESASEDQRSTKKRR